MDAHAIPPLCDEIYGQLSAGHPSMTIVIYTYDPQLDSLVGRSSAGIHRDLGSGLTIGMGLRLTGWVAAHRTTIVNSEAALDLGNLAAKLYPTPQLCLSTPILSDGKLVGVLTAYSTVEPFAARDVAVFEMLAGLLGPVVAAEATAQEPAPEGPRAAALGSKGERVPALRIAARR
jgi:GAF domain-containing protein